MAKPKERAAGESNRDAGERLSVFGRIAQRLRRLFSGGTTANIPSGFTETYTNTAFRFAFSYPPDLHVEAWQEGAVTTVRARNAARTIGFQISIRPIDGTDTAITPARIARDMPRVKTRAPETLHIRGAGTGLAFYTTERTFGDSFQAWLIRDGQLFQLSSYTPHAALLRGVLASWTFTK